MVLKKALTGKHKGKYVLYSRTKPQRPLKIFGKKKPLQSQVKKEERRIQFWKAVSKGKVRFPSRR